MTPPSDHSVLHWTNVDDRVALHAASTIRAFLKAVRRRRLRFEALPTTGPARVRFSTDTHRLETWTSSRDVSCAIASNVPGDSYEMTVSMPMAMDLGGDPVGDDPGPSIACLNAFMELSSLPGCIIGEGNDFLGLPPSDAEGRRITELANEAAQNALACWSLSDGTVPRDITVRLPLLGERGRISRIEKGGATFRAETGPDTRQSRLLARIVDGLPALAVLWKDGPRHFRVRSHCIEAPVTMPDPMEIMRRITNLERRKETAS